MKWCATLAFGLAVWLIWLCGLAGLMSYHEQYQLFLFTSDYFAQRIAMVGGLADYCSEFITQFYLVPWMGALGISIVLAAIQALLAACIPSKSWGAYLLSFIPSICLLATMSDENMLLSLPVAILFALVFTLVFLKLDIRPIWAAATTLFLAYLLLYWWAGPAAIIFPILTVCLGKNFPKPWIWILAFIVIYLCAAIATRHLWLDQYPLNRLMLGINYYRVPNIYPLSMAIAISATIALPLVSALHIGKKTMLAASIAMLAISAIYAYGSYDMEKMALLRYDYLVRNGRWQDILAQADRKAPTNDFAMQALNLALAKTGQMGDRMFAYPQKGIGSLIAPATMDNTSCLINAEIFYHLGMVNSAYRTNYELQEATMNDRLSGRFLRRMAECLIVNGKYQAAQKDLSLLEKSLFYSNWARKAKEYLNDEDKIDRHPAWGAMRRNRFKKEYLYDYPEIEKMLALLALDSEGRNKMAWDYFCAAALLKGDLPTFTGMYHYAPEMFGVNQIPRHHQEAIGMFWTFGHQNFDACPYPIQQNVQQRILQLAQQYMRDQNLENPWSAPFADTYCMYFLRNQSKQPSQPSSSQPKGSGRDD